MDIRCGLLGEKLGHSYSPLIHSMLGDYEYVLYEKQEEELEAFLLRGDWTGLNVTIPYKKKVPAYCSELSEVARTIGSVNTLVRREDGSLFGDNTDAYGFWFLLKQNGVEVSGKKVLILGSGGACASVRYVLEKSGARTVVISRSGEDNYENLERHKDASVIVNTTPVGMYPRNGSSPVDLTAFSYLEAVLDVIYNPARTALMLQAEELGIRTDNGLLMLVAQAYKSSEAFLGHFGAGQTEEGDEAQQRILQIHRELSFRMQNLILIGMPGCGKTLVSRTLGEMTGREVVDLDDLFAGTCGMTAGAYILQHGEEAFRNRETEVIREACKGSGRILATGGGCVTRPENYPLMHQNGRIIWIQRDISRLATEGRPLSQRIPAEQMYQTRKPLYEAFADGIADNNGDVRETAERILELALSGS